jgi:iron complex transport system substrate-binding protein
MTERRVISLLPAATEIVVALGAGETLVGISHECDYPPKYVQHLPHVTSSPVGHASADVVDQQVRDTTQRGESLFHLNEQRIAELQPDLLLTQALCDVCAVNENDVRAIATRLINHPNVVTLNGTTFKSVFDDIQSVADALDIASEGEELLAGLNARLRHVHETLKQASAPRPRVVVIEWTDPIYIAGHWVPELIRRAGGIDAIATAGQHSTVYTIEQIQRAAPDVLIISPCGYNVARAADEGADLLAQPEWRWARSIPVWAIDANGLMTRPGPRIVDGVETVAALLHPDLFAAPARARALRLV